MFKRNESPSVKTTPNQPRIGTQLPALVRRAYLKHSLGKRLATLMALAAAVSALLAGSGIVGLAASNDSLRAVYEDRMVPARELSRIHQLVLSNRLLLQTALSAAQVKAATSPSAMVEFNAHAANASALAIQDNMDAIGAHWTTFVGRPLNAKEAALSARFAATRERYLRQALIPAMAALRNNDFHALQLAAQRASRDFEDMIPQLEALSLLQFSQARVIYETGTERYRHTRMLSLSALLVSMLMMSWLGVVLIRSIVRPLERVIETFRQISTGHYDSPIQIEGTDEISKVMLALQSMQTRLGANEQAIHQLAFFDPLTKLPNRRLLHDRLQTALHACSREHQHGAVLLIDLDDFKSINDSKGHEVGDDLLVQMARRLTGCLRQADTVARLGGDEFVVVLVNLSADAAQAAVQAEGIGEKLLQAISRPCMVADQPHQHTASIGISLFSDQSATIDDLLRRADMAMYQAKTGGRNTQRFFDPRIQAALEARLALEGELRHALPRQQLVLFYQVQVDYTGTVLGAEVLLRWQHATRGLISPGDFIPIAEESGLIVPMGEWVLRTACEQLRQWQTDPVAERFVLSVNVSARQFRQSSFVAMVLGLIDQTGINTRRLKLELTESLVLDNVTETVDKITALNARGIQFSMDDFGTGFSSLSQLNRLPVAQLKIDRSFVSHITTQRSDAVIVQTIIGMANNLGLSVIAEGVETEQQRALLQELGCPAYQGYLFGRPVRLSEFLTLAQAGVVTCPPPPNTKELP